MHLVDPRPRGDRQRDGAPPSSAGPAVPRLRHLSSSAEQHGGQAGSSPVKRTHKLRSVDLAAIRDMRTSGATYVEIAAAFNVHHTTVMYHLDALGRPDRWPWVMTPHDICTAMSMHINGASYGEIGRALGYRRGTVRFTLTSDSAMRDYTRWLATHPVGPPPSVA